MKILTPSYVRRLSLANCACRRLRRDGFSIVECDVVPGDAVTLSVIVVAGGSAAVALDLPGVRVLRKVGGC